MEHQRVDCIAEVVLPTVLRNLPNAHRGVRQRSRQCARVMAKPEGEGGNGKKP